MFSLFTEDDGRRHEFVRAVLWNSECYISQIFNAYIAIIIHCLGFEGGLNKSCFAYLSINRK